MLWPNNIVTAHDYYMCQLRSIWCHYTKQLVVVDSEKRAAAPEIQSIGWGGSSFASAGSGPPPWDFLWGRSCSEIQAVTFSSRLVGSLANSDCRYLQISKRKNFQESTMEVDKPGFWVVCEKYDDRGKKIDCGNCVAKFLFPMWFIKKDWKSTLFLQSQEIALTRTERLIGVSRNKRNERPFSEIFRLFRIRFEKNFAKTYHETFRENNEIRYHSRNSSKI